MKFMTKLETIIMNRTGCNRETANLVANDVLTEVDKTQDYTLIGVMHFVDKWLDGAELEQDEVNRAATMREKTLQIVAAKQSEIERLTEENQEVNSNWQKLKKAYDEVCVETIGEFAERACDALQTGNIIMDKSITDVIYYLANKMKEELTNDGPKNT